MTPTPDFDLSATGMAPGTGTAPVSAPGERDCIIVADDAELSHVIMRRILSPHFDIIDARTGTEIVQILRSPPKPIAAILLDVMMPIMNGFQVLEFMQQNGLLGLIPVVAVTALSDTQSKMQCYEAGAFDVLDKPVDSKFLPFKLRWDIDRFRHLHALSSHPVAHAQVEQLEAILSALPAAIFVEDPATGVLLHCNGNFLKFRGVPEKPVGLPVDSFPIAPGMLSAIRAAREAILVDNLSKPVLYKGTRTGNTYSVLYRTFLNPVSSLTQLVGFITNVTNELQEITALENRIRELEGRLPS
ncbi:MAG: response regulator [Kiritimatiellae bacterium]|nr:response regulator [Kiritimatiellia bacterium]